MLHVTSKSLISANNDVVLIYCVSLNKSICQMNKCYSNLVIKVDSI